MAKKVTIKDIANLVGVSTTTISHYINGNYARMSDKTKQTIKEVIALTNYKPSAVAKGLATNDYKTIGVVIADITNPFIATVMKGINDACRDEGYSVTFTNSDNDLIMEMENINRLKEQYVSGIILDSVSADNPIIKMLSNTTTVMVDRQSKDMNIDTVISDNLQSTFEFITMMKDKKYEEIYFLSFPIKGISTREQRYKGFKKALNLKKDDYLIEVSEKEDLKNRISKILKNSNKKIGFFTVNGPTPQIFMETIMDLEYEFPKDYGVGTYEDLDWMRFLGSGMTCIRQDSYSIGKAAAERLIGKIKGEIKSLEPTVIEIPNKIIIRASL